MQICLMQARFFKNKNETGWNKTSDDVHCKDICYSFDGLIMLLQAQNNSCYPIIIIITLVSYVIAITFQTKNLQNVRIDH